MSVRTSEWIVCVYLVYLAGAALAARVPSGRRGPMLVVTGLVLVTVLTLARHGRSGYWLVARDWMPLTYVLLGYWLPVCLVSRPHEALERVLLASDRRWFGPDGVLTLTARTPRTLIELLELAYLCCYPLVPAGLACLYLAGLTGEVDRFWTAVLLAVLPCYGALPWLPTRPPRALERGVSRSRSRVRLLNLQVLARASVQWNTFPSGHAAAAVATALSVGMPFPLAGLVFGVIAAGIIAGSVFGRYHYAADTLSGIALGSVGFAVSRAI